MSQKALVPIVLPADPAQPLEAVTKQYVDARAGSEVEVGPSDPIGTNPSAELWYDSDAVAPLSSDLRWHTAWGIVAKGTFIGNPALTPTNLEITNKISFTPVTGRRYRLSFFARAVEASGATGQYVAVKLNDYVAGAATADTLNYLPSGPASYNVVKGEWLIDGDGVARQWGLLVRSNVNSVIYLEASMSAFYVEDVGPVAGSTAAPLSPDVRWQTAWGLVAQTVVTANSSGFTTNPVSLASVSFTGVAGRNYRVTVEGYFSSTVAGDTVGPAIVETGVVQYQSSIIPLPIAGQLFKATCSVNTAMTGAKTLTFSASRANGSGTVTMWAGPSYPAFIMVEDVGPVDGTNVITQPRDLRWFSAWGIITKGSVLQPGAAIGVPGASYAALTNPLSVTLLSGRRYRVVFRARAWGPQSGVQDVQLRIGMWDGSTGGAPNTAWDDWVNGRAQWGYYQGFHLMDGDGLAHTFTMAGAGATVALYLYAVEFYVEDVGPVTGAALIPQVDVTAWTALPLNGNWTAIGGTSAPVQYRKVGDMVQIRGEVRFAVGGGNPMATLPVGFRSPYVQMYAAPNRTAANGSQLTIRIWETGAMDVLGLSTGTDFSLGTIQFSTST